MVLAGYLLIAVAAPIIADNEPLFCFSNEKCLLPLVPYSAEETHLSETSLPPLTKVDDDGVVKRHWLGTDNLGRDVLSGLIHGTRVSVTIGFVSVLFIFIIGSFLGMLAAYYKSKNLKINIIQLFSIILIWTIGLFYMIYSQLGVGFAFVVFLMTVLASLGVYKLGGRIKSLKRISVPVDALIMRVIDIRKSMPGVFLVLAAISIFAFPSIWNVIVIIALLGWTEFARHARAEAMAVMESDYITTARLLGFSGWRILSKHVLPNILPTLLVLTCFSVAGAIITESTLSFLGIGLPVETVTWGKMMAQGRNMENWWMVVFPGLTIFIIILCLNIVADHLRKAK